MIKYKEIKIIIVEIIKNIIFVKRSFPMLSSNGTKDEN